MNNILLIAINMNILKNKHKSKICLKINQCIPDEINCESCPFLSMSDNTEFKKCYGDEND